MPSHEQATNGGTASSESNPEAIGVPDAVPAPDAAQPEESKKSEPRITEMKVETVPNDAAGLKGLLMQVGAIEFFLAVILLFIGMWALLQDQYDNRLNMFLGGGFIAVWVIGGVTRWFLGRRRG